MQHTSKTLFFIAFCGTKYCISIAFFLRFTLTEPMLDEHSLNYSAFRLNLREILLQSGFNTLVLLCFHLVRSLTQSSQTVQETHFFKLASVSPFRSPDFLQPLFKGNKYRSGNLLQLNL